MAIQGHTTDPGLHTSHLWTIWMRSVSDEHGVEQEIGEKGALVHRVGANEGMV
jgi:hypothetical protein